MIKAVIFDFDRTLTDIEQVLSALLSRFLKDLPHLLRKDLSPEEMYSILLDADKKNIAATSEIYLIDIVRDCGIFEENNTSFFETLWRDYFYQIFADNIVLRKNAYSILSRLRKKGYKLGILTNGSPKAQKAKLDNTDLADYIDEIVISGNLPEAKPYPSAFWEVCKRLEVAPDEAAFVGDHPLIDICGARAAGLTPIWLHYSPWHKTAAPPLYTVKQLDELPTVLQNIQENML